MLNAKIAKFRIFRKVKRMDNSFFGLDPTADDRSSLSSSDEEIDSDEALIMAVRSRKYLYDQSLKDYYDQPKLKNTWVAIAKELNYPGTSALLCPSLVCVFKSSFVSHYSTYSM
jgi:hypothetical protein